MATVSPDPKASELSQARMKPEPLIARTMAPSSTGSQRVPMATGFVTMATGTAVIQSTPSTSATTRDFTRRTGAPLALSQQYPAPNPAYTAPNPAYTAPNAAYTAPNAAYTAPNPAYTAPNAAYTAPNAAYTAPNAAYTAPNPAYTAPNPAYTAPNPAPQQQGQSAPQQQSQSAYTYTPQQYAPQQQSQAAYTYTPQQQQFQPSYTYTSQQYLPQQQQQLPSTYTPQYQPQNVQQPQYLRTSQPQTDITKHMKKVSIATFAGDKREYEAWKAAFDVSIDQQATSTEMKMLQLRQYLSGEALAVVQNLGFTPSAYSAARRRLEKRYGGQRRLVAVHMQELEDFPAVKNRAADFEKFADLLEVAVVKMTDAGMTSELGTGTLYTRMQKKLATENLVQYHRWVQETSANESVTTLLDWVNREAEIMATASETIDGIASTASSRQRRGGFNDRKPRNAESSGRVFLAEKKSESCAACSEQHPVWKCPSFKAKTMDERWDLAKEKRLCYRCLGSGHCGAQCPRTRQCGVDKCSDTHNWLLHRKPKFDKVHSEPDRSTEGERPSRHNVGNVMSASNVSAAPGSLRTVPVLLSNNERTIRVNAFLDDGATQTLISASAAGALGLRGETKRITMSTLNGHQETFQSMPVTVTLSDVTKKTSVDICANTVPAVSRSLTPVDWEIVKKSWPHLEKVKFPKLSDWSTVDLLIGIDNSSLHVSLEEVIGGPGEPSARRTPLGWTCVGPISQTAGDSRVSASVHHCLMTQSDADLTQLVRKFWEVDSQPAADGAALLTPDERHAQETVAKSIKHIGSQYSVGIPWKDHPPGANASYHTALKRLANTEQRLRRDAAVGEVYAATIAEHISQGYVRRVDAADVNDGNAWYLPHFPIVKPDKTTTKVRIVFDAAAKSNGKSLNDFILPGPKLQQDLVNVLVRFRREPIALVCDIAQMYLRISLNPDDRRYHRFLWRTDPSKPPEVYEFCSVVFGVNASPFLAQYVSQQHARSLSSEMPQAASVVLDSTYMDDSMTSAPDVTAAKSLYADLSDLWGQANMHARKWLSNSAEVLAEIPQADRASQLELTDEQLPNIKTLGVLWQAEIDMFTFQYKVPDFTRLTKRQFLRILATIFDPLGFLAPYIVRAKVLFQSMWIEGFDWDADLPEDLISAAEAWCAELPDLKRVQIPRCLRQSAATTATSSVEVFVDASEKAFGAVVYIRQQFSDGSDSMRLVASKMKVAPLAVHSIPRLELMAAVLGLQLVKSLLPSLDLTMSTVTFWSDSADVLYWIRGQSRKHKPFVAHRVGTIQTASDPDQWKHVATTRNPADLLTRGMSASQLADSQFWWCGPDMSGLHTPSPGKALSATAAAELKKPAVEIAHFSYLAIAALPALDPERYSSLLKLARVIAWINRFSSNARRLNTERVSGPLSVDEIRSAEYVIIRQCQQSAFPEEISALQRGKPISPKSVLSSLQPQLDEDGILRCGGRLRYAEHISDDARCPIILPRSSRVTTLIVKRAHVRLFHVGGTNQTLAALSQRFWIVSAREAIREYEQQCQACRRQKAKTLQQVMAPLPSHRTKPSLSAFATTAVDFCGPFFTKQGRGRAQCKRYMAVFTCTATRAVHLELVNDLTTDGFLNCLSRFVSRRGTPTDIISDNGTNFVGAVNELQQLVGEVNQQRVANKLSAIGVTWHFNPPAAPHFGGIHESMVKSAKRAAYAILTRADITDEELATCFASAESMLNSRPLTYQSAHPSDDIPLTPNHFLIGQVGGQFAPACSESSFSPRRRWRAVQHLIGQVWTRWMREWVPLLNPAKKWRQELPDLKVNDVVVVASNDTPRGQWPLARVMEVYPGKDNHVRVVKLRLATGKSLVRPIAKLCPLC
ncbi:uncharacterized protein LOC135827967 [Sycon ciliatum]|uniref:uncharacterized protein LOC135827967 n=1 Tax=Sycon ciliatum TaxID=27933 RepID=UPI0031F6A81E